ncbi:MAG: hypothetical protein HYY25_01055 [Candidatus Wallbacteria bacterium]|nr:hypothetical protein [Candidatus Wallbacteria bacterium]
MTQTKRGRVPGPRAGPVVMKPCEIRMTFWVRSPRGDDHTFSVAVGLLDNRLDLDVSFTDPDKELEHVSDWLIAQVQAAIELVRQRVRHEDLVERDD